MTTLIITSSFESDFSKKIEDKAITELKLHEIKLDNKTVELLTHTLSKTNITKWSVIECIFISYEEYVNFTSLIAKHSHLTDFEWNNCSFENLKPLEQALLENEKIQNVNLCWKYGFKSNFFNLILNVLKMKSLSSLTLSDFVLTLENSESFVNALSSSKKLRKLCLPYLSFQIINSHLISSNEEEKNEVCTIAYNFMRGLQNCKMLRHIELDHLSLETVYDRLLETEEFREYRIEYDVQTYFCVKILMDYLENLQLTNLELSFQFSKNFTCHDKEMLKEFSETKTRLVEKAASYEDKLRKIQFLAASYHPGTSIHGFFNDRLFDRNIVEKVIFPLVKPNNFSLK